MIPLELPLYEKGAIQLCKTKGKVSDLEDKSGKIKESQATLGYWPHPLGYPWCAKRCEFSPTSFEFRSVSFNSQRHYRKLRRH